jgi:Protein of unknown function (DUF3617)
MRALLILLTVDCGFALLSAQSLPVKMGLWEKKLVTTSGPGEPALLTAKSCVTPGSWEQMMANATKPRKECTMNTVKNEHGYTYNGTCNISGVSLQMSGSSTIKDSEHIVSESHSRRTQNGKTRETVSRSESHFVSSNCGGIKPGESEIE